MNSIKFLLILASLASANITGLVKDSSNAAVQGAIVQMNNLRDTTNSDGSFILISASHTIITSPIHSGLYMNGMRQRSNVTYDLNGRLIKNHTGSGIYLYKNPVAITRSASLGKTLAVINDTVKVTKAGFVQSLVPVSNSDTAVVIRLEKVLTITDRQGNVYNTIKIGTQIWMRGGFRDSTANWGIKYPYYSMAYSVSDGLYYGSGVWPPLPVGWHMPTKSDLDTFITFFMKNQIDTVFNTFLYQGTASLDFLNSTVSHQYYDFYGMNYSGSWWSSSSDSKRGRYALYRGNKDGTTGESRLFQINNPAASATPCYLQIKLIKD